jgi:hypothetical protein
MLQEQQQKPDNSASPVAYSDLKIMYVPLANQYAQAGYLSRFADEEYIESLPTIPFSDDVEHRGEYMCFEVRETVWTTAPTKAILKAILFYAEISARITG